MRAWSRLAGALAALALTSCQQASPSPSRRPEPGGPSPVRSAATEAGAAPFAVLPCGEAIDSRTVPLPDQEVVLGVVALHTSQAAPFALQTSRSGEADPAARLFSKSGLEVKSRTAFEIVVPDEVASRLSIGWGSPARRTRRLAVPGCDSDSPWLVYAGGYWVRQAACQPLLVRAGRREQRVLVGIGAPCPGQQPPPQPTET